MGPARPTGSLTGARLTYPEEPTISARRRIGRLCAAAAALAVIGGCSDSAGDDPTAGGGSDTRFSMQNGLEQLPLLHGDAQRPFTVTFTDVDEATRLAGTTRPSGDGPGTQRSAWAQGFQGRTEVNVFAAPYVGWERLGTGKVSQILGYSVPRVSWYATSSVGRIDTTVERLLPGTELNPDLPSSGDMSMSGPGQVGAVDTRPLARGSGFPTVTGIAERDELVAMSNDPNVVKAWQEGPAPSMATVAPVADVARVLDRHGAYAGQIASRPPVSGRAALSHPNSDPRITVPLEAVGVGATLEDGQAHAYAVYRFGERPAQGARQVRTVWTKGFSGVANKRLSTYVTVRDVTRRGPIVTVDLEPRNGGPINIFMMSVYGDAGFRNVQPPAGGAPG